MSYDSDADFAFALQLQSEFINEEENSTNKIRNELFSSDRNVPSAVSSGHNVVEESLELFDPTPDIYALFREFDRIYFQGKLSCCEVKWSPRMTMCAGLCCYERSGGLCSIRLSAPLLRLRPRKDLVQTLLHEMIHAYLFVTHNNKDHDAHGPEFLKHMHNINKLSGANITVYHTFHDEVDSYRKHWWQCNGPCKTKKPFYGLVKSAVNRVPGPSYTWWSMHQKTCNGTFIKIKSPDTTTEGAKRKLKESKIDSPNKHFAGQGHVLGSVGNKSKTPSNHSRSIEKFLNKVQNKDQVPSTKSSHDQRPSASIEEIDLISSPPKQSTSQASGKSTGQKGIDKYFRTTHNTPSSAMLEKDSTQKSGPTKISKLTGKELYDWIVSDDSDNESTQHNNSLTGTNGVTVVDKDNTMQVLCPACNFKIPEFKINEHLDQCLS